MSNTVTFIEDIFQLYKNTVLLYLNYPSGSYLESNSTVAGVTPDNFE